MEKSMEPVRTRGEVEKKYTWDLTRIFEDVYKRQRWRRPDRCFKTS